MSTSSSTTSPSIGSRLPPLIPRKRPFQKRAASPGPDTPPLPPPVDHQALTPIKPIRRILSEKDLQLFSVSEAYSNIVSFVFSVSEACTDTKVSSVDISKLSPILMKLRSILSSISSLVDENPRIDQGASRYGNSAFKGFFEALTSKLDEYHTLLQLPSKDWGHEIGVYLQNAFGSPLRLDYGSGHELNFIIWLLSLNRLGFLPQSTFRALALVIFRDYLILMRKIQSTYYLEPAGSHGVWGLDDYQFFPFLVGASQLLHHPYIRPLAVHNELVLEEEGDEFLYLDMVRWTVASKTVRGLKWTQPMLDDISGAKNWAKIEQGMRKIFLKEVLGKLPIMQHMMLGSLIAAEGSMSYLDSTNNLNDISQPDPLHKHTHSVGEDCCGIKIPSAIAAASESSKNMITVPLRTIPFD